MRILSLHVSAFGAITDQTLQLGPGLNVVYGPNSSGKTTWHAALYAGLCASPGGAGDTDLDRRFAAARRPRPDRGVWRVITLVQLDDDTQLEVDQNLADRTGRVQSSTGGLPGFTAQVDHPGGVDLSTLLGLDRRSYAATAWVEQSHPLPVLDQAGDGRNDLQRAVALCIGEDEAARAIQRLDQARQHYVGSPSDPYSVVRRAKQDADAAREALGHAQYLRANAIGAEQRLAQLRAGAQRATRQRQAVQLRQERAAEQSLLAQLFYERSGTPPPDPGPPPPRDATEPDPEVVAAAQALRELEQSVAPLPTSPTVTGMAGWVTPVRLGGAILAGLAGIGLIIAIVAGSIPAGIAAVVMLAAVVAAVMVAERARPTGGHRRRRGELATTAEQPVNTALLYQAQQRLATALTRHGYPCAPQDAMATCQRYLADLSRTPSATGSTGVAQLERELAATRQRIQQLSTGLTAEEQWAATTLDPAAIHDLDQYVQQVDAQLRAAEQQVAASAGAAAVFLPVEQAQDAFDAAEGVSSRLQQLDRVLQAAAQRLAAAREELYREVAAGTTGLLAGMLLDTEAEHDMRLHLDSELRYLSTDSGDQWHESDGTEGRIYLFARIALGRYLSGRAEHGPLLLDGVTSQLDAHQLRRVLRRLHDHAEGRQIVVFAQDAAVRKWAKRHRSGPNPVFLHTLSGVGAQPVVDDRLAPPPNTSPSPS